MLWKTGEKKEEKTVINWNITCVCSFCRIFIKYNCTEMMMDNKNVKQLCSSWTKNKRRSAFIDSFLTRIKPQTKWQPYKCSRILFFSFKQFGLISALCRNRTGTKGKNDGFHYFMRKYALAAEGQINFWTTFF